jgi:hypothetical protein
MRPPSPASTITWSKTSGAGSIDAGPRRVACDASAGRASMPSSRSIVDSNKALSLQSPQPRLTTTAGSCGRTVDSPSAADQWRISVCTHCRACEARSSRSGSARRRAISGAVDLGSGASAGNRCVAQRATSFQSAYSLNCSWRITGTRAGVIGSAAAAARSRASKRSRRRPAITVSVGLGPSPSAPPNQRHCTRRAAGATSVMRRQATACG